MHVLFFDIVVDRLLGMLGSLSTQVFVKHSLHVVGLLELVAGGERVLSRHDAESQFGEIVLQADRVRCINMKHMHAWIHEHAHK